MDIVYSTFIGKMPLPATPEAPSGLVTARVLRMHFSAATLALAFSEVIIALLPC